MGPGPAQPSLNDFAAAIEKLEPNGSNWVMFEYRFTVAVKQKGVYGHFDGTSKMPTEPEDQASGIAEVAEAAEGDTAEATATTPAPAESDYATKLAAWLEKEQTAHYLLMQKLPDSILMKYK